MNFCSHCGAGDLAFEVPEGDNRPRFICRQCGVIHYQNPRIIAGCLPVWEDKVLLCRRAIEPRKGFWNVPAGFLENGETVEAGACREVWEEACARVEIIGIHALYSIPRINQVYIHFLGTLVGGNFGVGEESLESRLFTEAGIPWDDIAFHSSEFALRRFFEDRQKGIRRVHIGSL
ncbi:MAG: NUDIX domain-containing protein [Bacteroidetes bacterium]|nr:MAG: NUDIX domain-containing protein [Bacteroidota bacterium]